MNKSTTGQLRDQIRDTMETAADSWDATAGRSKEALEKMSAATTKTTEAMQYSFSTALKGIQQYNTKLVEFAGTNSQSHMEFVQRLATVKSPLDFMAIFQDHSSRQLRTLTEQATELRELVQQIASSSSEPLREDFSEKAARSSRYRS